MEYGKGKYGWYFNISTYLMDFNSRDIWLSSDEKELFSSRNSIFYDFFVMVQKIVLIFNVLK